MAKDDAQIISKLINSGNPEGFWALFRRYASAVEKVTSLVWDQEIFDQNAAVEEAFALAFSSVGHLREPGRFFECLLGTAYAVAHRHRALANSGSLSVAFEEQRAMDVSSLRMPCGRASVAALAKAALETLPKDSQELACVVFFQAHATPRSLDRPGAVEVAQVGRAIAAATTRSKMFLIAAIADEVCSRAAKGEGDFGFDASAHHLNDEVYGALLRGEIPQWFSKAFAEHLRAGCPICEETVRRHEDHADALDGVLWAGLFSNLPSVSGRQATATLHRILRRLQLDARLSDRLGFPIPRTSNVRSDRLPLALGIILGVLGLCVFALHVSPEGRFGYETFQNGTSRGVQISISAMFQTPESASLKAQQRQAQTSASEGGEEEAPQEDLEAVWLSPGQKVSSDAQLSILYAIGQARFSAILRLRPDEKVELLDMPGRQPTGTHTISINGASARLLLRGAEGLNRFVVVTGISPLHATSIRAAVDAIADRDEDQGVLSSRASQLPEGVEASWFDVHVVPSQDRATEGAAHTRTQKMFERGGR